MSIISKDLAWDVAVAVCHKKCSQRDKANKEFKQAVADSYLHENVPLLVTEMYQKIPEFITHSRTLYLKGNGWNTVSVFLNTPIIVKAKTDNIQSVYYYPSEKESKKLQKLFHVYEKLKKEYDDLLTETQNTLLTLKTYKRVQEQFPLAYKYLPVKAKTEVIVNISQLLQKIES
jgi:hypothetical protein